MKSAVVLLSGGLDSATTLAIAKQEGYRCYALSFVYGQRHQAEIEAAKRLVRHYQVHKHCLFTVDLQQFGGSALTDQRIPVPCLPADAAFEKESEDIPSTYVPARNTVFLSLALAWAETLDCHDIFIGVNAVDYCGYPDCRPAYIEAFSAMANLATRAAVEGQVLCIHTPLLRLSKAEIIRRGVDLGLDYSLTVSCYQADSEGLACGHCASCVLRRQGFAQAGVADCTRYRDLASLQ